MFYWKRLVGGIAVFATEANESKERLVTESENRRMTKHGETEPEQPEQGVRRG
jgi:hypothetical protein